MKKKKVYICRREREECGFECNQPVDQKAGVTTAKSLGKFPSSGELSVHRWLLSTHGVLSSILGTQDTPVSKADKGPTWEACNTAGEGTDKK
jgi:hypothetical protein